MAGAACYFQHFHYFLLDWDSCFFSKGNDFWDLQRTVVLCKLVGEKLVGEGGTVTCFSAYVFPIPERCLSRYLVRSCGPWECRSCKIVVFYNFVKYILP